jgi:aspartate ammonia-lyase
MACPVSTCLNAQKAAEVAKIALTRGLPLREAVLEARLLSAHQLDEILDPFGMTTPGVHGRERKKVGLF